MLGMRSYWAVSILKSILILGTLGFNEIDLKSSKIVWIMAFSFILLVSSGSASVYAQNSSNPVNASDWNTFDQEAILTDPIAQKILEKIELSKQILYDIQNPQRIVTPHELYIEQQRMLVQQQLQEELDRMNKNNANYTARAAFAKFVAKVPEMYHDFYWELFEYMHQKVTTAREYRDKVIENGGSYQDAQRVFVEYAKMPIKEKIWYQNKMILKYNLLNKVSDIEDFNALPVETQKAFAAYAKKNLGDLTSSPETFDIVIYDNSKNVNLSSLYPPEAVELVTISSPYVSLDALQKETDITTSSSDNYEIAKISFDEQYVESQITDTHMDFDGKTYTKENMGFMNTVSEFTLSAWVKPDYSKGSSEFTIIGKEKAFTLTINNNKIPEKTVRFSIFDGFKWTIIESSSAVEEAWTHIAAKFDGHVISLYINGNLEAAKQLEGIQTLNSYGFVEPQPIEIIYSESMILYGAHQTTKSGDVSTKGYFSGSIDEIVIDDHGYGYKEILDLCNKSQYF